MNILERVWITGKGGCFGLVVVEDEFTGDRKIRGAMVSGRNQEQDERFIARNGSLVPVQYLEGLIKTAKDGKS